MPNFAELFGAPTWPQVEEAIHAALTEADHPHADDLRRLLKQHDYRRPTDMLHGGLGIADMIRAAEERREQFERERGSHD